MKPQFRNGYTVQEPVLSATERAWEAAVGATRVLEAIEARLVAAGAITELRQLHGLSAQEVDVLLRLEADDIPAEKSAQPPVCSQTPRAEVAA